MGGERMAATGSARRRRALLEWGVGLLLMAVTFSGLAALALPGHLGHLRSLGLALVPPRPTSVPTPIPTPTSTATTTPIAPPLAGWTLIWDDEFNGTGLDASKWNVESHTPGGFTTCCLDDGLQAWTPRALSVHGGSLWITSARQSYDGKAYTSGAITTLGKFSFRYGRVDIRAQLPRGDGLWSAFWLLPARGTRPGYSPNEIDMMEALGQGPQTVNFFDHWDGQKRSCLAQGQDFTAGYHLYTLEWSATALSWIVDGVPICQLREGVPQQAMYLLLNTYVGGTWPRPVDASTVFPQLTTVDYVRVYQ